jgi:hypothetical protein
MDEARLQRINDIQRAIIEIYQQRYGNGVIPQKLLESLKTLYQSEPKKRKRSTRGERAAESILNSSEQTVPEGTNGDARHIDSSGSSQSVLDNAKFHARTFCPGNQPFGSQLFWFLSYCWVLRKSGLISPEDAVTVLNLTTVTQNATEYYVNAILSGVQRLHMLILRLHEEEEWPLIYAVDEISRGTYSRNVNTRTKHI